MHEGGAPQPSQQCSVVVLQAVERAISELTRLQKPLQKESDVAELTMGARSKEKVLEIMETGTLRSNEALANDEQQQVIQLVITSIPTTSLLHDGIQACSDTLTPS